MRSLLGFSQYTYMVDRTYGLPLMLLLQVRKAWALMLSLQVRKAWALMFDVIMYHHIMVRPSLCTVFVSLDETSGQTPYRGLVLYAYPRYAQGKA